MLTKLSDNASHAYENYAHNKSSAERERPHHQEPDSDEDVISFLSTHGSMKMPPFYPTIIQGRNEDAPVTDNPKTYIIELHLASDDERNKYIAQFRL